MGLQEKPVGQLHSTTVGEDWPHQEKPFLGPPGVTHWPLQQTCPDWQQLPLQQSPLGQQAPPQQVCPAEQHWPLQQDCPGSQQLPLQQVCWAVQQFTPSHPH